jgi:hypothetical protein
MGPAQSRAEYGRRYAGQVAHLNAMLLESVDRIRERDPEAVVVVFSDHGSAFGLDWADVAGSDIDERTANLLAVRSPGASLTLEDDVTLVNVLSGVLNSVLGFDIPLQPDEIFTFDGSRFQLKRVPVGEME